MRRVITVPESRPAGAENSNHGRHLRSRFRHAWRRASAPATVAKVARHFGLSASDVHCKSTSDLVGQLRVWPRHHARDLQVFDLSAKEQRTQQETGGLTQLLAQLAHARTRVVMLQLKMFGSIAADAHEPSRFPAWMQVHNATPPKGVTVRNQAGRVSPAVKALASQDCTVPGGRQGPGRDQQPGTGLPVVGGRRPLLLVVRLSNCPPRTLEEAMLRSQTCKLPALRRVCGRDAARTCTRLTDPRSARVTFGPVGCMWNPAVISAARQPHRAGCRFHAISGINKAFGGVLISAVY